MYVIHERSCTSACFSSSMWRRSSPWRGQSVSDEHLSFIQFAPTPRFALELMHVASSGSQGALFSHLVPGALLVSFGTVGEGAMVSCPFVSKLSLVTTRGFLIETFSVLIGRL